MKTVPALTFSLLFSISGLNAQQETNYTLAVNDLIAQGVKESDAVVISEQIRTQLMKSPNIRLIERGQMQEILKEQGFQKSGCTSDECVVEAGQLLGVKNIVTGTVGTVGSYTVLSVRVLDVSNGQIIANESVSTKGGMDKMLEEGIKNVVDNLQKKLFPNDMATQAFQPSTVKNNRLRRALIIGSGGVILVGGGFAAYMILNKTPEPNPTNSNNTRIVLP